ncbi:hypothetical protein EDB89DRAFT_1905910, partial [Lactarius sanguifluus]
EDEESNDDVGPMPMPKGAHSQPRHEKKKRKEQLFLDHLPNTDRYHKRVLHHDRDMVNFVVVTWLMPPKKQCDSTDFITMTSVDGIESVKHCRAHMSPILGISASTDGVLSASVAEEGSESFRLVNFDMINMIKLTLKACCWVHRRGKAQGILAVYVLCCSEQNSGTIRLYDGLGDGQPLETGESALIPHPLDDVRRPARPSNARTQASILLLKEHFLVQLLASDLNEDDHFLLDIDNNAKQSWESKSESLATAMMTSPAARMAIDALQLNIKFPLFLVISHSKALYGSVWTSHLNSPRGTNRQSPWSLQSCGYIQDPESPTAATTTFACPDCFGAAIHTS